MGEDENAFEVPREQLSKFTGKAPPTKSQLQEAIEKAATEAGKKNNESAIVVSATAADDKVDKAPEESLKLETSENKSKVEDPKTLEKKEENVEKQVAEPEEKEGTEE